MWPNCEPSGGRTGSRANSSRARCCSARRCRAAYARLSTSSCSRAALDRRPGWSTTFRAEVAHRPQVGIVAVLGERSVDDLEVHRWRRTGGDGLGVARVQAVPVSVRTCTTLPAGTPPNRCRRTGRAVAATHLARFVARHRVRRGAPASSPSRRSSARSQVAAPPGRKPSRGRCGPAGQLREASVVVATRSAIRPAVSNRKLRGGCRI